ncbi:MAG TPA: hypothetical protein VKG80_21060 [Trebonia sp.]|nr:hypothetical protein [Trebonia sp.]
MPTAPMQALRRRPQGTDGPRRHAQAGQPARPANPSAAQTVCGTETPTAG